MEGSGSLFQHDEKLRSVMEDPSLDITQKQVLMALYSQFFAGALGSVRDRLPIYLSMDWNDCVPILDGLERAGLLRRSGDRVELTYTPARPSPGASCGCG
jgi:DNA-binding MarR family transcriptional regulator